MQSIILSMAGWLVAATALSEGLDLPAEHHAWGRFPAGSWARYATSHYTLDSDDREVVGAVEKSTVHLVEVHDDGVSLREETGRDGADQEPAPRRLGWDALPIELERSLKLSVGEIKLDGRSFTCQTHE